MSPSGKPSGVFATAANFRFPPIASNAALDTEVGFGRGVDLIPLLRPHALIVVALSTLSTSGGFCVIKNVSFRRVQTPSRIDERMPQCAIRIGLRR